MHSPTRVWGNTTTERTISHDLTYDAVDLQGRRMVFSSHAVNARLRGHHGNRRSGKKYLVKARCGRLVPSEVPTGSGKCVTRTNRFPRRRRNLLIQMKANHRVTHSFFSCTPVTLKGDIPAAEVTATDSLSLLVREEVTHPQARATTLNAPNRISRTPNESILMAASQLADAFRASVVDRDRPHATETISF